MGWMKRNPINIFLWAVSTSSFWIYYPLRNAIKDNVKPPQRCNVLIQKIKRMKNRYVFSLCSVITLGNGCFSLGKFFDQIKTVFSFLKLYKEVFVMICQTTFNAFNWVLFVRDKMKWNFLSEKEFLGRGGLHFNFI